MRLDWAAAILRSRPDRLQVPLTPIRGLRESPSDELSGGFFRTETQGGSVRRIVGDFIVTLHSGTIRVRQGREGVFGESRLSGEAAAYTPPEYQYGNSFVNSKVSLGFQILSIL
jgi:hypothetical protein